MGGKYKHGEKKTCKVTRGIYFKDRGDLCRFKQIRDKDTMKVLSIEDLMLYDEWEYGDDEYLVLLECNSEVFDNLVKVLGLIPLEEWYCPKDIYWITG